MRTAVTASLDRSIKMWDITTGQPKSSINTMSQCYDMHISNSETKMVSGHNDCSIKMWDINSKECTHKFEYAHNDKVSCVRFTADEKYIVSTSKDDTIKIWDIRQKKILHTFEHDLFRLGST